MKLPSIFKYADIISDLLKKYSKYFSIEELNYIQQQIPRSYLPWIFKRFQGYLDSANRIRENNPNLANSLVQRSNPLFLEDLSTYQYYLTEFENHKQDLRNNNISTNINDYDLDSLKDLITNRYINKSKWVEAFDIESLRKEIPVVFEDENWIIFTPQTEEQACEVGKNTDWCTTRGSFESYYSKDNPIYDLVNKNTERRWQYDKESGMFFTESDEKTDFKNFYGEYKDQITEELLNFLVNTSGKKELKYIDDTESPEFKAYSYFSTISPISLFSGINLIYGANEFFDYSTTNRYKEFILNALSSFNYSIERLYEFFESSYTSNSDEFMKKISYLLSLFPELLPKEDFSFDNLSPEKQDAIVKEFNEKEKTAGLVDTLKNLYQKVFKSSPEEQEIQTTIPSDIQPAIEPIEIPYFEKTLPSGISSEDVELVSKPAGAPPPPPGDRRPWILPIPEDYNPKNDHSYNTFKYLYSLGYRDAIWHLAESHGEYDQCDDLNGMSFTTDWLLFASQHNPPSPIYSRSHPDCRCFVTCNPPSSPEEIPDDAPGLPMFGTDDQILEFKRKIFANLVTLDIDSQTMAPPEEHLAYLYSSRLKFGKEDKWKENIVPVKTQKDFRLVLPLGLYRPMIEEYVGIKLEENNEMTKSYIYDLNRIVYLPNEFLTTLDVKKDSSSREVKPGEYVYIDDSILGIVTRIIEDKVFCFIPDFNIIAQVSSYTPLNF